MAFVNKNGTTTDILQEKNQRGHYSDTTGRCCRRFGGAHHIQSGTDQSAA